MTAPGSGGRPPVGALAEEAALLLDALAAKLSAVPRPQPRAEQGCPECGHDPAEACAGCPLCRLLAILQGQRPEATARLLDAAGAVVTALRALIPDSAASADQPPERAPAAADESAETAGLQRIRIT